MLTVCRENFFQLFTSLVSFTPVSTKVWVDRLAATAALTAAVTTNATGVGRAAAAVAVGEVGVVEDGAEVDRPSSSRWRCRS